MQSYNFLQTSQNGLRNKDLLKTRKTFENFFAIIKNNFYLCPKYIYLILNQMKTLIKFISLVLAFCFATNVYAQDEKVPNLVFQARDDANRIFRYQISDDLKIQNTFEDNMLHVTSSLYDHMLSTSDFSSFGVGYFAPDTDAVDSVITDLDCNGPWRIITVDGLTVAEGDSGAPTFAGLQSGRVYIVTIGDKSFKYLHLK